MKTIHKYGLEVIDRQNIELPLDAEILSVEKQRDGLVLYALVDKVEVNVQKVSFLIFGTGHPVPDDITEKCRFLGTVNTGNLMWHVFLVTERG